MTVEKQNEFLLSLVDRLYFELGVYRGFFEYIKLQAGDSLPQVEAVLAQCRRDPALRRHVDATLQELSAKFAVGDLVELDQLIQELLLQWIPKGKAN